MNHKDRIPNSKQINLVVSKLVLVWHGCLFWCMSSCLVCYLKRKRKTFVCNEYAQNKNIERIQELSLSLIDQENKIQKYIHIKQEWKEYKKHADGFGNLIRLSCIPVRSSFSIAGSCFGWCDESNISRCIAMCYSRSIVQLEKKRCGPPRQQHNSKTSLLE